MNARALRIHEAPRGVVPCSVGGCDGYAFGDGEMCLRCYEEWTALEEMARVKATERQERDFRRALRRRERERIWQARWASLGACLPTLSTASWAFGVIGIFYYILWQFRDWIMDCLANWLQLAFGRG